MIPLNFNLDTAIAQVSSEALELKRPGCGRGKEAEADALNEPFNEDSSSCFVHHFENTMQHVEMQRIQIHPQVDCSSANISVHYYVILRLSDKKQRYYVPSAQHSLRFQRG